MQAGTRNFASYTNLPGGEYTFRVRAANSDGVWNKTGQSLRLVIQPHFYETWWFWTIVGVGVAGAVTVPVLLTRDEPTTPFPETDHGQIIFTLRGRF